LFSIVLWAAFFNWEFYVFKVNVLDNHGDIKLHKGNIYGHTIKNKAIHMLDDQTIELSLPNIIGYERIAMGCIDSFATSVGFRKERIEDLKTAVAEACINAMQHGNKDRPSERVIVNMTFANGSFNIAVIVADLDPPTGFGLFLIKRLVDQVEFNEKTIRGHGVRMVFDLS
jgi:serine/threonine-protein kinase RsbW